MTDEDTPQEEDILTTVVTSFRRPGPLRTAVESLANAGAKRVVITSGGTTRDVQEVLEWAQDRIPGTVIVSRKDDPGCNACWLAGVEVASTPFIHILHDDDVVRADCYDAVPALKDGDVGFLFTDAFMYGDGPLTGPVFPSTTRDIRAGKVQSNELLGRLMAFGNLAVLSAVNGFFRREVALEALREAEENFTSEWQVRPGMMVGNDLLLWVRACESAPLAYHDPRPVVGYGTKGGSTTEAFVKTGRYDELRAAYDRTRSYIIEKRNAQVRAKKSMTDRILVTLADENFRSVSELTHPSLKAYAERLGCDFHVISTRRYPGHNINYEKFQMADLLGRYKRIAYIDSDVLVRPNAPDIFDEAPPGKLAAMNETLYLDFWTADMIADQLRPYDYKGAWDGRHFNAGVMLLDESHKALLTDPVITDINEFDQAYINFRLQLGEIPVHELRPEFNFLVFHPYRPGADIRDRAFFMHYSGVAMERRIQAIKAELATW